MSVHLTHVNPLSVSPVTKPYITGSTSAQDDIDWGSIHPKLYFKLPIRIENFMNFPLPCSVQFVLKRGSVETGWLQSNENFYLGFSWLVAKYNSSEY